MRKNNFLVNSLLYLLYSLSCSNLLFAFINKDVKDQFIERAYILEKKSYFKNRIKSTEGDFLQHISIGKVPYTILSYFKNNKQAITFIINEKNKVYFRLKTGPIYGVMTADSEPSLGKNQFLIISSINSKWERHIVAYLYNVISGNLNLVLSYPLHGVITNSSLLSTPVKKSGGKVSFEYVTYPLRDPLSLFSRAIIFYTLFEKVPIQESKNILGKLKIHGLKEYFWIKIDKTGQFIVNGSEGIKNRVVWLFDLKDIKTTSKVEETKDK